MCSSFAEIDLSFVDYVLCLNLEAIGDLVVSKSMSLILLNIFAGPIQAASELVLVLKGRLSKAPEIFILKLPSQRSTV